MNKRLLGLGVAVAGAMSLMPAGSATGTIPPINGQPHRMWSGNIDNGHLYSSASASAVTT